MGDPVGARSNLTRLTSIAACSSSVARTRLARLLADLRIRLITDGQGR